MKHLLLAVTILFIGLPVFSGSVEIEQTEPPKTVQYVFHLDDEDTTIDTHNQEECDDSFLEHELELKGSVIYTEGEHHIDEIVLDENIKKPHINLKTSNMVIPVKTEPVKPTIFINDRSALSNASRLTGEEYIIAPVYSYITEQTGNFSYGTIYSSGIDSCQLQSTLNLYTRYDFKYFALTGAVGTNESNVEGTSDRKTIEFAPEIKLSKSFVIRDTVKAYVNETYRKNKISIIYTPQWKKHPDILRFELGLTHTYYTGGKVNSAIEFSTRIRL